MKQNRKVLVLFLLTLFIIVGIIIFITISNNSKDVNWDIVILHHWNNPLAGVPIIDDETLYIDSKNCVGKVTYYHYNRGYVETQQFKIEKEAIHKILQLAEKGEIVYDKNTEGIQTVYEIQYNTKITYVDSNLDEEHIIAELFNHNVVD